MTALRKCLSRRRPRSTRGEMRLPCRTTVKGEVHCWHRFVRLWDHPPPARGTGHHHGKHRLVPGITPACAGNSGRMARGTAAHRDHPRLHGEQLALAPPDRPPDGSPPPARGAAPRGGGDLRQGGITPACAGSSFRAGSPACPSRDPPACAGNRRPPGCGAGSCWDHPRLRGEQHGVLCRHSMSPGSPPPARGTARASRPSPPPLRITPACAGNSTNCRSLPRPRGDHPRLRGEQLQNRLPLTWRLGSPPPARGTVVGLALLRVGRRITPACAGNSSTCLSEAKALEDHPRLRGEQQAGPVGALDLHGSPPPARGTVNGRCGRCAAGGITPACAGNRADPPRGGRACTDHPRLRGEQVKNSESPSR